MTEFLVIRHGETAYNVEQRFQGQVDVPLNATGRAQAERLARRLAAAPADLLVCSDLLRARETAAPLARAWKREALPEAGLREQAFGVLEGLDLPTIQARHADLWAQWLRQRADFALPGGESVRAFHGRVIAAMAALADTHPGRRIAVVTHGGVLDMLWRSARGLSLDGLRECAIPNTGINTLLWRDGRPEIVRWADDGHLAAP